MLLLSLALERRKRNTQRCCVCVDEGKRTSFRLTVGLVEGIGDCEGVGLLVVVAAVFEVGVVGVAA